MSVKPGDLHLGALADQGVTAVIYECHRRAIGYVVTYAQAQVPGATGCRAATHPALSRPYRRRTPLALGPRSAVPGSTGRLTAPTVVLRLFGLGKESFSAATRTSANRGSGSGLAGRDVKPVRGE
jgi:hypothetical protein